ncbi:transposase [Microbacterium sp. ZW T5_45]|uniref:transposase n=1 Tax=Microbacterium sp. ZW T5_45 TaxID=3378080 RepID=UPI003851D7C6
MTDGLADIAAELYVVPLAEFTAARNARAAQLSDRRLATAVRALRKPSVAAWIVNVFAQEHAAQLGEALQLAAELRDAQDDLDAAALSQLGRQRRMLTRRLAEDAVALARARGERVTASTVESVHSTISAAFFDPQAAAAIITGRLIHALEPGAEAPWDPGEVVAGGDLGPATASTSAPVDEVAARRELRRAERAVHDAERERVRAERAHATAVRAASEAADRTNSLERRVAELEQELATARQSLDAARTAADDANGEAERRAEELRRAAEQEDAARASLQALRG